MYSKGYQSILRLLASPLLPQTQGWKYVKLVGSNLDLRQVSWKKRVDVISSRLSTDTETSSDEGPHPSYAQTPLPGEDHSIRAKDRQTGQLACQLLCTASQVPGKATKHFSLSSRSCQKYQHLSNHSISGFSPCPLAPSWHLSHLSSRHLPREEHWHQLPHLQLMIGGGQAFPGACLSSLHPTGEVVIWRQLVGVCV